MITLATLQAGYRPDACRTTHQQVCNDDIGHDGQPAQVVPERERQQCKPHEEEAGGVPAQGWGGVGGMGQQCKEEAGGVSVSMSSTWGGGSGAMEEEGVFGQYWNHLAWPISCNSPTAACTDREYRYLGSTGDCSPGVAEGHGELQQALTLLTGCS